MGDYAACDLFRQLMDTLDGVNEARGLADSAILARARDLGQRLRGMVGRVADPIALANSDSITVELHERTDPLTGFICTVNITGGTKEWRAAVAERIRTQPGNVARALQEARLTERIEFLEKALKQREGVAVGPRDEAVVAHRPGHRPPVGWRAVVEIVSASDLEADDVIFAEGRWLCVLDDDLNDSTQVMAAEIIDDAGGRGVSDTTYGEWFARVVALVPRESPSEEQGS